MAVSTRLMYKNIGIREYCDSCIERLGSSDTTTAAVDTTLNIVSFKLKVIRFPKELLVIFV